MLAFLLTIADDSDRSKVEYIYNHYYRDMMHFARYSLRYKNSATKEDAEDVVQNTFIKIIKNINKIDFSRDSMELKRYVFTIVYHEASNLLNDTQVNYNIDDFADVLYNADEDGDSFIARLDLKNRYNEIVEVISKLDEKYSFTLYLFYCQDMSVQDIADEMGISQKTVYTRLARGKKLLLDTLESGGKAHEK